MATLTVFFDNPWWVGVVEFEEAGVLRAFRHVFGGEPSDEEVYAFIGREFVGILERPAAAGVPAGEARPRKANPKRAAREAARATRSRGVSTRAQEALRLELEERKLERRTLSREEKRQAAERKREEAREKRQRHGGGDAANVAEKAAVECCPVLADLHTHSDVHTGRELASRTAEHR